MVDTKHTPGPWNKGSHAVTSDSGEVIFHSTTPMTVANARLIAAAPELLEVLVEATEAISLLETLTSCGADDDYVWGLQERISIAIARATGEA